MEEKENKESQEIQDFQASQENMEALVLRLVMILFMDTIFPYLPGGKRTDGQKGRLRSGRLTRPPWSSWPSW